MWGIRAVLGPTRWDFPPAGKLQTPPRAKRRTRRRSQVCLCELRHPPRMTSCATFAALALCVCVCFYYTRPYRVNLPLFGQRVPSPRTPPHSAILCVWHSGSSRFHADPGLRQSASVGIPQVMAFGIFVCCATHEGNSRPLAVTPTCVSVHPFRAWQASRSWNFSHCRDR